MTMKFTRMKLPVVQTVVPVGVCATVRCVQANRGGARSPIGPAPQHSRTGWHWSAPRCWAPVAGWLPRRREDGAAEVAGALGDMQPGLAGPDPEVVAERPQTWRGDGFL